MPEIALTPNSNILITGVTGLIGGEILRCLLDREHPGQIWPLIRATNESPMHRLGVRFARSQDTREIPATVRAVNGDIQKPVWGMNATDANTIRNDVDVIVHNAADTSFVAHRNTSDTNVESVRQLIDFAKSCRRNPLVVYMGTASNVGDISGCSVTEEDGCRAENRHYNEYTHSKAIAENLLRESGLPLLTLRPSIVLSANLADETFARQILWCAPLTRVFRALPLNPDARLDLVDVGFVAAMTVRLMEHTNRTHDCYHLSAGKNYAITLGELGALIDLHYGRRPLKLITPAAWTPSDEDKYVRTGVQRRVFRSLHHYLPFLNMNVTYESDRLRQDVGFEDAVPQPVVKYINKLLDIIPTKAAMKEAAVP